MAGFQAQGVNDGFFSCGSCFSWLKLLFPFLTTKAWDGSRELWARRASRARVKGGYFSARDLFFPLNHKHTGRFQGIVGKVLAVFLFNHQHTGRFQGKESKAHKPDKDEGVLVVHRAPCPAKRNAAILFLEPPFSLSLFQAVFGKLLVKLHRIAAVEAGVAEAVGGCRFARGF